MAAGIRVMLAQAKLTPGRKHHAVKWCEKVGVEVAAYITVRTILDDIATPLASPKLNAMSFAISRTILDELRYRRFRAEVPGLFEYRMAGFTTSNYAHKKRSLDATMLWAKVHTGDLEPSDADRLKTGSKLIDIFIVTTGMVEIKTVMESGKRVKRGRPTTSLRVVPTKETIEWLKKRNERLELLHPICLPMVTPPLEWGPGQRGGYRFGLRGRYPLARQTQGKHRSLLDKADMPVLYAALNTIQGTAWRINDRVYDLIRYAADQQRIPGCADEPLPAKPPGIDDKEIRRQWRRRAAAVKDRNHKALLQRLLIARTLSVAQDLLAVPAIYFPYNLDFRGRIYPIPNYLNPQGDDLQKSLLLFSTPKPLGPDGHRWLALHGANTLDETPEGLKMSTLTIEERIRWVESHSDQILDLYHNPLSHPWWPTLENPFQFYAFAAEWAGYLKYGKAYQCSLPVSQDGTCNGIQHFSALFRDPVGGRAVNLIPTDSPNDLYQLVCNDALARLERDAAFTDFAALWLSSGLVTRKLTKRPAMTFGYGSRRFGFTTQFLDYCRKHENYTTIRKHFEIEEQGSLGVKNGLPKACQYLADVIWECLSGRVVAAFEGMEWLRKCVTAVCAEAQSVEWTVPGTGLRVRQEYYEDEKQQVKTIIAGVLRQPCYYTPTSEIRNSKQVNAISPNFIHSLDAAVLVDTVNLASSYGVTDFAFVHDSYATLPADAGKLARATREAFVNYYETHDPIDSLYREFLANVEDQAAIPRPPERGALDLSGVLDSLYFFA